MRSLMIKHAAKVTAINPSAARFAHEEMLGFMLVRISVLGNIFSARDFHSPLFNLCFPHCLSLRDGLNTRSTFRFSARIIPMRAIMVGRPSSTTRSRALTAVCHASRFCSAFRSLVGCIAQSHKLPPTR